MGKKILLFLFVITAKSQTLHHQMLASQGTNSLLQSGVVVHQSVGQQSAIGNYRDSNLIVGQGFQQGNKMKTAIPQVVSVATTTYPNPFVDTVNFQFSSPVSDPIKVTLFDVMGRLVYYKEKVSINNIVTIDNLTLAQGEYFVKLTSNNYIFLTKILKE